MLTVPVIRSATEAEAAVVESVVITDMVVVLLYATAKRSQSLDVPFTIIGMCPLSASSGILRSALKGMLKDKLPDAELELTVMKPWIYTNLPIFV